MPIQPSLVDLATYLFVLALQNMNTRTVTGEGEETTGKNSRKIAYTQPKEVKEIT